MGILSPISLLFYCLFISVTFCYADPKTVEVVGIGECADCAQINIEIADAFSGLKVTIDCKQEKGEFKTRGVGELNKEGKFQFSLPSSLVDDNGKLKEECYAQLHSASSGPCAAHNDIESAKLILTKTNDNKHTLGLYGKLKFSSGTCTSAFFLPRFKHPSIPKLPPIPKWKLPPLKGFGHHFHFPPKPYKIFPPKVFPPLPPKLCPPKALPPPVPVYKPPPVPEKPLPPPVPIYKPPPVKKPCPPKKPLSPPVPVYKPPPVKKSCPPKKPLSPPVPVYKPPPVEKPPTPTIKKPCPPKKPLPPPVPIYKPPPVPVKPLPPPVPIYKPPPPIYKKPSPPLPKLLPFPKKPCPPLPKLPPFPKIPPKVFHHPKFGKWPPLPPFSPIH